MLSEIDAAFKSANTNAIFGQITMSQGIEVKGTKPTRESSASAKEVEEGSSRRKRVIGVVVLFSLAFLIIGVEWMSGALGGGEASGGPSQCYYSADDGATFFVDDVDKPVPFQRDGKTVVRAHVFKDGSALKVSYLSRSSAAAQKSSGSNSGAGQPPKGFVRPTGPPVGVPGFASGIEVKAPGKSEWIDKYDPRAAAIMKFKGAVGAAYMDEVYP